MVEKEDAKVEPIKESILATEIEHEDLGQNVKQESIDFRDGEDCILETETFDAERGEERKIQELSVKNVGKNEDEKSSSPRMSFAFTERTEQDCSPPRNQEVSDDKLEIECFITEHTVD